LNFRTYLHSDNGTYTPELDNIAIALNSDETFYTDKTGSVAINALNSDIANDQWVQYKAILYSDGRNAPTINSFKLTYVDTWLNITAPNGGNPGLKEYLIISLDIPGYRRGSKPCKVGVCS